MCLKNAGNIFGAYITTNAAISASGSANEARETRVKEVRHFGQAILLQSQGIKVYGSYLLWAWKSINTLGSLDFHRVEYGV